MRMEATEPWKFSADKTEDLRAWLLTCRDYFSRNAWQWQQDTDKIKYAIGRFKDRTKAQDFGIQYRREMEGSDGFLLRPAYRYWATFESVLKERFLSAQEAQEARNQMDAEKYKGDIGDLILVMKRLNNLVRMSGVTLRTTIERKLTREMRQ